MPDKGSREIYDSPHLDNLKELLSILIIHQSVIEDSIHLMDPQSDQLILCLLALWHGLGFQQEDALDDAGKVSQVEDVVRLGRGR